MHISLLRMVRIIFDAQMGQHRRMSYPVIVLSRVSHKGNKTTVNMLVVNILCFIGIKCIIFVMRTGYTSTPDSTKYCQIFIVSRDEHYHMPTSIDEELMAPQAQLSIK